MKREELKAKGIADEHIDDILNAWHNGHKSLLDQVQALTKERDEARAETKKYQKGGEFYVDKTEIERLQNFEKDTLTKEVKAKKTAGLTKLFKDANASDTGTKLLIKSTNLDDIELDDKGNVKGGAEILKQAKADYADIFEGGETGVPQSHDRESAPATTRKKFY
jgi:hypothetical protein